MNGEQIEQQISIIRSMVERSRRETAESGHFFLWLGAAAMAIVLAVDRLEAAGRSGAVPPVLVASTVLCGVIGYFTVAHRMKSSGARTYSTSACCGVWIACGAAAILATLLLPMLGVYTWASVPILASLIVGIGVFSSGVILDASLLIWCSLAWWVGAVGMAFAHGTPRALIMAAIILVGWIVPGAVLNRAYRRRRADNEA